MSATTMEQLGFSPKVCQWFAAAFTEPTTAQEEAWRSISTGAHSLVVAPTGSGKTLAAFLWALDRLSQENYERTGTSVVYVSPLKALAVDVDRNLRAPLAGLRALGLDRDITTGVRTGDTPANVRAQMVRKPPDILITTPESLYLMLTSAARETLVNVHTVIVDEVHAIAHSKRGAHLALSLERLSHLTQAEPQRIGLSATVRPKETVAAFLAGDRPVTVVDPPSQKRWDITIDVPVADLSHPDPVVDDDGNTTGPSIWPHIHRELVEQIRTHQSTLIFVNSRRLAERVTTALNDLWREEVDPEASEDLVHAHHGSVAKERRKATEDALKSGHLKAVVATSSLELGIDMGAVDLVIQLQSPPSVSSGLQRIGRAGHQVGETSRAIVYPTHPSDLVAARVTVAAMVAGELEPVKPPRNPLDVLAQQIVAMVSVDDWTVSDLLTLVRRAHNYANLSEDLLYAVLDLLSGKYPSEDFNTLRARLNWDRHSGVLSARPGSKRLAVTSGGTIPDRGLFGVFLAGEQSQARVGELDEEMVYESRVGDVFSLGSAQWRIAEITHDRVLVTPAPGQVARLPFWHGDGLGRPVGLGESMAKFFDTYQDEGSTPPADGPYRLAARAQSNLNTYLKEQATSTAVLPGASRLVIERFRDEIGDVRVVIHSPYGMSIHQPWALILEQQLSNEFDFDAQVMAADDGIVLRLPAELFDLDSKVLDSLMLDPETISTTVSQLAIGSALFASRFREVASRALLFGQQQPGKRLPLWQQRQRSAQLLAVTANFPSFPMVLETMREILADVYDIPALTTLMRQVVLGQVSVAHVTTDQPSPFARSLLFGYVAQFLYEGDSPLAERKSAALSLDSELMKDLLGTAELRELLDPEAIAEVDEQLRRLGSSSPKTADALLDFIRTTGPVVEERLSTPELASFLAQLQKRRQVFTYGHMQQRWVASVEDAGRIRDALGVPLPTGIPETFLEPVPDAVPDLVKRFARNNLPFTPADLQDGYGLAPGPAQQTMRQLVASGLLLKGEFLPAGTTVEFCDPDVLRRLRRASAAKYSKEIAPTDQAEFSHFPVRWQRVAPVGSRPKQRGRTGLLDVIENLAGCPFPASQLERVVLPSRVADYSPAMLDELTSSGEVSWWGVASLPGDGWIALAPRDIAPAFFDGGDETEQSSQQRATLSILADSGGWFADELAARIGVTGDEMNEALLGLLWQGIVTNDTLAPVRSIGKRTTSRSRRRFRGRASGIRSVGRWSALPTFPDQEPNTQAREEAALIRAESLLLRRGIVVRDSVTSERTTFAAVYPALKAMADKGMCRRGYFVNGLGGLQFAHSAAADLLRTPASQPDQTYVLAASDPANPYGAELAWPEMPGGTPMRRAGAFVLLTDGRLAAYGESKQGSLLVWEETETTAQALLSAAGTGLFAVAKVKKINGANFAGTSFAQQLLAAGAHETPSGIRLH